MTCAVILLDVIMVTMAHMKMMTNVLVMIARVFWAVITIGLEIELVVAVTAEVGPRLGVTVVGMITGVQTGVVASVVAAAVAAAGAAVGAGIMPTLGGVAAAAIASTGMVGVNQDVDGLQLLSKVHLQIKGLGLTIHHRHGIRRSPSNSLKDLHNIMVMECSHRDHLHIMAMECSRKDHLLHIMVMELSRGGHLLNMMERT